MTISIRKRVRIGPAPAGYIQDIADMPAFNSRRNFPEGTQEGYRVLVKTMPPAGACHARGVRGLWPPASHRLCFATLNSIEQLSPCVTTHRGAERAYNLIRLASLGLMITLGRRTHRQKITPPGTGQGPRLLGRKSPITTILDRRAMRHWCHQFYFTCHSMGDRVHYNEAQLRTRCLYTIQLS